jgi:hypothetical protein
MLMASEEQPPQARVVTVNPTFGNTIAASADSAGGEFQRHHDTKLKGLGARHVPGQLRYFVGYFP